MRIFGIDPGSIRTGYGCVDATGAGSGTYRKGPVRIKRPPGPDQYFVVEGEVSACLGDSGGAAFLAGPRRPVQVSVTSREHPSDPRVSFLASLTTAAARAFLRTPLPGEAAPPDICGVGRPPEACD